VNSAKLNSNIQSDCSKDAVQTIVKEIQQNQVEPVRFITTTRSFSLPCIV
jgi:hypothetical protein